MTDRLMDSLRQALVDGDHENAVDVCRKLVDAGVETERVVTDCVETAMEQLDAKCTAEQFNLLEIMLAGRAVMGVLDALYPANSAPPSGKAVVVVASLKGDVHDLGKNIVKAVLTANGYRVVDCGKDCDVDVLLDAAECEGAAAVGISGLITRVIDQVRTVRDEARARGLNELRVMAGGAALKQASAEQLNVDFVGTTVFDCLHYMERVAGES